MVITSSGWTTSSVVEVRLRSLPVLLVQLELTTVSTLKMLESDALEHPLDAPLDQLGLLVLPTQDALKSATIAFGEQCVMTTLALWMQGYFADS